METLLNVVWLFVSACGIGVGIGHLCGWRTNRPAVRHSAIALALVAVLLFPVISLTDDLRPVTLAPEDISRRSVLSTLAHAPAPQSVAFLGGMIFAALVAAGLVVIGVVPDGTFVKRERRRYASPRSQRAPPACA